MDKDYVTLRRASASRPTGEWSDDAYEVVADGVVVGRIMTAAASPEGSPWLWTLAFGQHEDRTPTHGYAPTREDAPVKIVLMGDANVDWLAYGLEDAFSEQPEIGIVRKHRTASGLIRYDQRRDSEWPQVAREIIAAEKPKFVVMMIGNNDRETIRERSEEHTSELQSHLNLVCRLLLEKKKKRTTHIHYGDVSS